MIVYNTIGYNKAIEFMDKDPIDWDSSSVSYRELIGILAELRAESEPLYAGPYGGDQRKGNDASSRRQRKL